MYNPRLRPVFDSTSQRRSHTSGIWLFIDEIDSDQTKLVTS